MNQSGFIFPKVRGENKESLKPPPSNEWKPQKMELWLEKISLFNWMIFLGFLFALHFHPAKVPRIYRSPGTNDDVVEGKRGGLGDFLLKKKAKMEYSILPETNSLPPENRPHGKGDSYWKPAFFWGLYVSLRECKFTSPLFLPETNELKPETNIISPCLNGWLGDDPWKLLGPSPFFRGKMLVLARVKPEDWWSRRAFSSAFLFCNLAFFIHGYLNGNHPEAQFPNSSTCRGSVQSMYNRWHGHLISMWCEM